MTFSNQRIYLRRLSMNTEREHARPLGACGVRAVPTLVEDVTEGSRDGVFARHEAIRPITEETQRKLLRYAEIASHVGH
jgi:hypothetical protein